MASANGSNLRRRLLTMALVAVAPLGVFAAVSARFRYDATLKAISRSERQAQDALVAHLRAGMDAARHLTSSAGDLANGFGVRPDICVSVLGNLLAGTDGYLAARLTREDGTRCEAIHPAAGIRATELEEALGAAGLDDGPATGEARSQREARFGSISLGASNPIVVTVRNLREGEQHWISVLVMDANRFAPVLDTLRGENAAVALYGGGDAPLLIRGNTAQPGRWLPGNSVFRTRLLDQFSEPDRDGEQRLYHRAALGEADLTLLVGFSLEQARAAWLQFLALVMAPILTAGALIAAHAQLVKRHVLRWTQELATAARIVAGNGVARAPDNPDMPAELRDLGHSFNRMVERQEERERSLEDVLAHNRHLARELHHRVKNSLQIVQSYLGLSKREHTGEARRVLTTTECRVHVLSTAYRLALQNGEMRKVPLSEFFESVAGNVTASLREPTQWVEAQFEDEVDLDIDRAIPLGLVVVESMVLALSSQPNAFVCLRSWADEEGLHRLEVSLRTPAPVTGQDRLLSGLVDQAGARAETPNRPETIISLVLPI